MYILKKASYGSKSSSPILWFTNLSTTSQTFETVLYRNEAIAHQYKMLQDLPANIQYSHEINLEESSLCLFISGPPQNGWICSCHVLKLCGLNSWVAKPQVHEQVAKRHAQQSQHLQAPLRTSPGSPSCRGGQGTEAGALRRGTSHVGMTCQLNGELCGWHIRGGQGWCFSGQYIPNWVWWLDHQHMIEYYASIH